MAELAADLQRLLTNAFPGDMWVRGEIRNLAPARGDRPDLYFSLVEPGDAEHRGPDAMLDVALFRDDRSRVNAVLRRAGHGVRMVDGVEIRARGRLRWWSGRGRLRLVMTGIDPAYTLGRLAEQRAAVLAELSQAGLLDRNANLPMPSLPLHVGLVTAAGSAAYADVIRELEASRFGFHVVFADVRTQGLEAAPSMVAAIAAVARRGVDVVLLARGGGARTDLTAFDDPALARAVATCPVPVVCGIGHEIDRTVIDEVAHTSCKTPTAAAATLVAAVERAVRELDERWTAAIDRSRRRLAGARDRLASKGQQVGLRASSRLALGSQSCDHAAERLRLSARRTVATSRARIDNAESRVAAADPRRALARGWSITRDRDGRIVRHAADIDVGTPITTTFADGEVQSRVAAVHVRPIGDELVSGADGDGD